MWPKALYSKTPSSQTHAQTKMDAVVIMPNDLLTFAELGLTEDDILDISIEELADGGYDIRYQFTEEGEAIMQAAAHRAGLTPGE